MVEPSAYRRVTDWLRPFERPLLLTHRKPDGDALGAVSAMAAALAGMGKAPQCALFEAFPARYPFLEPIATWRRWDLEADALRNECDAVVILDTCAWSQLEPVADYLRHAPPTLVVDHHPTRDPIGERPGDLTLVDTTAAAACVLVAEWAFASDVPLTSDIAAALFTGIATDTGWFRFSNTDGRTFGVAQRLADAGANPNALYRPIYERDTPAKLRLISRMLDSLEMRAAGQLAVLSLRKADFALTGADPALTEDLVNEAGRLGGIEGVILVTEDANGLSRVNLRSKTWLDVAEVARQFGGGGHARAAGARIAGPVDGVVAQVVAVMERAFAERSGRPA